MRIFSDVVKVDKKISKEGKNGYPYYALGISYKFHSEKKNEDFTISELVFVSPKLYDEVNEGSEIILEGIISRNRDSGKTEVNYYSFKAF